MLGSVSPSCLSSPQISSTLSSSGIQLKTNRIELYFYHRYFLYWLEKGQSCNKWEALDCKLGSSGNKCFYNDCRYWYDGCVNHIDIPWVIQHYPFSQWWNKNTRTKIVYLHNAPILFHLCINILHIISLSSHNLGTCHYLYGTIHNVVAKLYCCYNPRYRTPVGGTEHPILHN